MASNDRTFVGIQAEPHVLADEGFDRAFDNMRLAGVNALLVYTHTYYGAHNRPVAALADDHGTPPRDERANPVARRWVPVPDDADLPLRHQPEAGADYAGHELFAELVPAARGRGLQVFGRILEPRGEAIERHVTGWLSVLSKDIHGNPAAQPDRAHPGYGPFWANTVADAVARYGLDGFQFGSESVGPLSGVLLRGEVPWGFGAHEVAAGRDRGIDPDAARDGYRQLHAIVTGETDPPDGVPTACLRVLFARPEVLAWERMLHEQLLALYEAVCTAARGAGPGCLAGVHVDHQQSSYDPLFRALFDAGRVASFADFLKPILYHDIVGPRMRHYFLNNAARHGFRGIRGQTLRAFFFEVFGLDADAEPQLDELEDRGLSPEYVRVQTARLAAATRAAGGGCPVWPGIGIDIPRVGTGSDSSQRMPSDPAGIAAAVTAAFEGGADGIVVSREYGEMRLPGLRAVGEALGRLGRKPA